MPDVTAHAPQVGAGVDGAPLANRVCWNSGDYRHRRNVSGYDGSGAYHRTEPYSQPWQHDRVTENHDVRLYDDGGVHGRETRVVKIVVRRENGRVIHQHIVTNLQPSATIQQRLVHN